MAATTQRFTTCSRLIFAVAGLAGCFLPGSGFPGANIATAADGTRFARSDSDARYVHHIELYDADNRKIAPDSQRPYSPVTTCGRCHDYETISHGWHFNAFLSSHQRVGGGDAPEPQPGADAASADEPPAESQSPSASADEADVSSDEVIQDGRRGEPWIWTDPRTGTQLPLSYRDWPGLFDPSDAGITPFEMAAHFGGRIPGGGVGAPGEQHAISERWELSGQLHVDCMICHATGGVYDFQARREQIEDQNFAWAPTAGLHLATIDGSVSRIRDGADPESEATQERLPEVTYDESRFAPDGTVFFDLVRQPESNACYQCHSNRLVSDSGIVEHWVHDEDVHLRAGMVCADCHRNGIGHHIVRGFKGEQHPSAEAAQTLSCRGCHLGTLPADAEAAVPDEIRARAGRLGSPQPAHAGLPRVHFEKLSCTACHGGPVPREQALRVMTSLAHGLGEKDHRSGKEWPAILGPVFTQGHDGKIYPQRTMWPAYWGSLVDGSVRPLPPEKVFEITRRALRVRRSFVDEVVRPEPSRSDLRDLIGEERSRVDPAEWTDEETARVEAFRSAEGEKLFQEKVAAALTSLEEELDLERAVYVSTGVVYARGDEEGLLTEIATNESGGAASTVAGAMIGWPIAHPVRPAGWSLGVAGCTECHSDDGLLFASTVQPTGPGPHQAEPIAMQSLQGVDADQRRQWNQMFGGRASFKYLIAASLVLLGFVLLIGIGAKASRLASRRAIDTPLATGDRRPGDAAS